MRIFIWSQALDGLKQSESGGTKGSEEVGGIIWVRGGRPEQACGEEGWMPKYCT